MLVVKLNEMEMLLVLIDAHGMTDKESQPVMLMVPTRAGVSVYEVNTSTRSRFVAASMMEVWLEPR